MTDLPVPHLHDVAFSALSRRLAEVFFLQIGAADGKQFDPIYPLRQAL